MTKLIIMLFYWTRCYFLCSTQYRVLDRSWAVFHLQYDTRSFIIINIYIYVYIYIFVNCKWASTRWHLFETHLHTNNTQDDTKQTIHRTTQNLSTTHIVCGHSGNCVRARMIHV
jgi:hypothetical protein